MPRKRKGDAKDEGGTNGGADREEAMSHLLSLSAAELRAQVEALKNSGAEFDSRVSGSKAVLAGRVLEGTKAAHPRSWKEDIANLGKGKSTKRRRPGSQSEPRPSVSAGNGWPLYVERGRLQRAAEQQMYLVARPSWTQFTVIGASMTPYVVQLVAEGQGPVCSCPDHRTRKTVCKHILFTLLRVLNLSPFELEGGLHRDTVQSAAENQLNFLMDEEPDLASTSGLHHRKPAAAKEKRSPVEQRPVDRDDSCAICCSEFEGAKAGDPALVFCRYSCGKSLHSECFEMLKSFEASKGNRLLCVYCRQPWGS